MKIRAFQTRAQLDQAVAGLLLEARHAAGSAPQALLLAGGQTPLAAYTRCVAQLEREPPGPTPSGLHLMATDERMVPDDAPESNYRHLQPLSTAFGLPTERVLRADTALPLPAAADQWHSVVAAFLARGGSLPLGLLGLGADGHTASLFSRDDLARGRGRWVIPVPRAAGPHRVSVTPDLLARAARLIFVAAGPDKAGVVAQLVRAPETLVAGLAVAAAPHVELWFCPAP